MAESKCPPGSFLATLPKGEGNDSPPGSFLATLPKREGKVYESDDKHTLVRRRLFGGKVPTHGREMSCLTSKSNYYP